MTLIRSAALTDKGMKREQNQDSILCAPEIGLFAVADGMGGHHGGEVASQISIQNIETYFRTLDKSIFLSDGKSDEKEVLMISIEKTKNSIRLANSAIQHRGTQQPELKGMGTTTSVLFLPSAIQPSSPTQYAIMAQVGDSRCYYIHKNKIWQLTKDHSLVQERLRAGLITRSQAKKDRNRNIITRSVGYESQVEVDVFWIPVQKGDRFLLCSDGLHGLLEEPDMLSLIDDDLERSTRALINRANENGGDDNVSAILVEVS